jgi:pyruvate dehydrogenase E2 component (dihydrolipoamide acetyltransferase)
MILHSYRLRSTSSSTTTSTMKMSAALLVLLAVSHAEAFGMMTIKPQICASYRALSTDLFAEGSKVFMPALSSTMKEGKVVTWLKNEGDEIEAGEAIMVVESDKADMDVEAFEDGFLAKIIVGEGEIAPVGEAVALIAATADDIQAVASGGLGEAAAPASSPAAGPPASSGGEFVLEVLFYNYRVSLRK